MSRARPGRPLGPTPHSAADLRVGTGWLSWLPPQLFLSLWPSVESGPLCLLQSLPTAFPCFPQAPRCPLQIQQLPFFPASLLLLQLVPPSKGGVQIHLSCPFLLVRPLPCLDSFGVWLMAPSGFPQVRGTGQGASLPHPTGLLQSKVCVCLLHLSSPRTWRLGHQKNGP